MNKKKLFCFLLLCIIIMLICSTLLTNDEKINISKFKDITIVIKKGTLSETGATIIITDLSKNKNKYDEWYRIDKKVDNKWLKLKENNTWINLVTHFVDENNTLEMKIDWKDKYGNLKSGEYRLIKKVNQKYIAVEFTI